MGTPAVETVPTLDELQAWARDSSRESWRELISGLTDLFIANLEADAGQHGEAYSDIVCRLLDDVATEVRKELSERVAPMEQFPGRVVKRLATDDAAEVASPMLEHSPVLTERDLIEVIEKMMPDHTLAISKRKTLNESLTDALVKRGDNEAVRSMAANPGARFSPKTYRAVAERAKTDVGLQESLVDRDDLTHVITCQITPFLSDELKARLQALDAPPEGGSLLDSLSEIASESELKAKARKGRAAVYALVEQVLSGDAKADAEVIKLAETGDQALMTRFLAGIAQLPEETVSASLSNPNGTPLAILLRGLNLSTKTVAAIGEQRSRRLNLSDKESALWLEGYDKISSREAEKSLQMLRQKANAEAAQSEKATGRRR